MNDAHGNSTSGTTEGIRLYDRAVDRFVRFDPEVLDRTSDLLEHEASTPMGHALFAYLNLSSTDHPDVATAAAAHRALVALPLNEREQAHAAAIEAWVAGDWTCAARRLDDLLQRWPADLLALFMGHQLDFFVGDAQNLRDRIARSLPAFAGHAHEGFVQGMLAFGLEESGHYEQAEATGLRALAAHPEDVWAVHAVTHVYEMEGRVHTGIEHLRTREADWGTGNLFTVHNWWHLALFCLEAGDIAGALDIYDRHVRNEGTNDVPLELVDASAMLWRLHLDGIATGDRFADIAGAWAPKTAEPWYVFNDLHAVMALAGADRLAEARSVVQALDTWLDSAAGTNARMTSEIGLPACRAVVAFAEGRHADVVAELAPIRRTFQRFGGSHAQRDVLQRTLLESAQRAGLTDLARALLSERLVNRPTSVYGWTQQARLLTATGADVEAKAAAQRASHLRSGFAGALGLQATAR